MSKDVSGMAKKAHFWRNQLLNQKKVMRTGQEVDVKDDEKSITPISKDIELDAQKKEGDQQLTPTLEHQSNAPNV